MVARPIVAANSPPIQVSTTAEFVRVEGGRFRMGSDDHYPEEAPVHTVAVDGFSIRSTTVTNREYAAFIDDTGYVTVAERPLEARADPRALRLPLVDIP